MDITQQIKNWAIDSYLVGCVYERRVILSGQTQYATLYVIQTKSRCWGLKNQLRNINVGRWNFQNKTIKKMDWPSWTDYDLSGPFQTTFGQFRPYLTLSNHLEPFRTTVDFFGPFQTQQKKSVNGFFWTVPWIPSIKEAQLRFVAQIGEEKQIRAVTLVTGWVTSVTSSRTKF